jgi:hypothetical protein
MRRLAEDADSCERVSVPKARGMAKSPAIARRFAVVRWKLGGLQTNQERFMADCEAIGGRTVLKAENYAACKQGEQHSEVTTALALACVMPLWPATRGSWSACARRETSPADATPERFMERYSLAKIEGMIRRYISR